jgi:acetoin utilization deacetylase AcuC-like enzyme
MQVFDSSRHALMLPPGHRFPAAKYPKLRERVQAELPAVVIEESLPATEEELALAHTERYIAAVVNGTLSAAEVREIGFPWTPAMVTRSRHSVGATIAAARAAMASGVSANLAGGTHHSSADHGSGYCIFNDVAVAARLMQGEAERLGRGPLQVAVIDLDVHQGNGTAAIFRDDPTVFTLSLHSQKNFPFRKEVSDFDVGLPDGCADDEYLAALDQALAEMWSRLADVPLGLVFYLAGADAHESDRLGRLKLTSAGLAERDRRVFGAMRERRIPVAATMAGGYSHVVDETVALHLQTLREAFHSWQQWNNPAA